jgi:hypothetical protein
MSNLYKTANGQAVDMNKLRLTNETAQAVGNMHVNARGDEIDSKGNIIKTRNEIVRDQYRDKNQHKDNQ